MGRIFRFLGLDGGVGSAGTASSERNGLGHHLNIGLSSDCRLMGSATEHWSSTRVGGSI